MSKPVLRENEGEKGEKLGFGKRSSFGWVLLPISCSYETKQHTRGDLKR